MSVRHSVKKVFKEFLGPRTRTSPGSQRVARPREKRRKYKGVWERCLLRVQAILQFAILARFGSVFTDAWLPMFGTLAESLAGSRCTGQEQRPNRLESRPAGQVWPDIQLKRGISQCTSLRCRRDFREDAPPLIITSKPFPKRGYRFAAAVPALRQDFAPPRNRSNRHATCKLCRDTTFSSKHRRVVAGPPPHIGSASQMNRAT